MPITKDDFSSSGVAHQLMYGKSADDVNGRPIQQSFLGSTIRSFSVQAGTGSNPSVLNVQLVDDASFNGIPEGGRNRALDYDAYHVKSYDSFNPPSPGMPVFFYYDGRKTKGTLPKTARQAFNGADSCFTFGGILQSVNKTSGSDGFTRSVTVVDPRMILGNVKVILDGYAGTVNVENVINIYGLLEHEAGSDIRTNIVAAYPVVDMVTEYGGSDMFLRARSPNVTELVKNFYSVNIGFPITGLGMSRRGPYGIPYYRVLQGLAACMTGQFYARRYTGLINFRGVNYGIKIYNAPLLDPLYMIDSQSMSLLDLFTELAEATNHEIFVQLKPGSDPRYGNTIEVAFIDKSKPQKTGQISSFVSSYDISSTSNAYKSPNGTITPGKYMSNVKNTDIGIEISNPCSQKIIVGANKVEMIILSSAHDEGKSNYFSFNTGGYEQGWDRSGDVIKPYYGSVDKTNIFNPSRGTGPWEQIFIDTSAMDMVGVAGGYVTTVAELRIAQLGFEKWRNFLISLNGTYFVPNSVDQSDGVYKCGVPRCRFISTKSVYASSEVTGMYLPVCRCSPPYGYPLYFGRASAIGASNTVVLENAVFNMAGAGSTDIFNPDSESLHGSDASEPGKRDKKTKRGGNKSDIEALPNDASQPIMLSPAFAGKSPNNLYKSGFSARQENAKKVHAMLKSLADECLGKKFLVRIPTRANEYFKPKFTISNSTYVSGPIGFAHSKPKAGISKDFIKDQYKTYEKMESTDEPGLIIRYDHIHGQYIYNYLPCPEGGYSYDPDPTDNRIIPENFHTLTNSNRISSFVRFDYAKFLVSYGSQSVIKSKYYSKKVPSNNRIPFGNHRGMKNYDESKSKKEHGWMKVSLDSQYYFPPLGVTRKSSAYGGVRKKQLKGPDGTTVPWYYPNAGVTSGSQVGVWDFRRLENGTINNSAPDINYPHVLITLPVAAFMNKGENTPGSTPFAFPGNIFGDEAKVPTWTPTTQMYKDYKRGSLQHMLNAYWPMDNSLFEVPYLPDLAVIALEHQTATYGPWHNSQVGGYDFQGFGGGVEYSQDTSLAPWNYGGFQGMNIAALSMVSLSASVQSITERGSVTYAGFPAVGRTIGEIVAIQGPTLTDINIQLSASEISTTYKFDSNTQSFQKQQQQISKRLDHVKNSIANANTLRNELLGKSIIGNRFINYGEPVKGNYTLSTASSSSSSSESNRPDRVNSAAGRYHYHPANHPHNPLGFQIVSCANSSSSEDSGNSNSLGDSALAKYGSFGLDASLPSSEAYVPVSKTPDHSMMPSIGNSYHQASHQNYEQSLDNYLQTGYNNLRDKVTHYS